MNSEVQKLGRDILISASIEKYEVVGEVPSGMMDSLKSRVANNGGQYAIFHLRCQHDGRHWMLRKRFSEFAALHASLVKKNPSVPPLPSKSLVRQFSPEALEARKVALNKLLADICTRRDVCNCTDIWDFFSLAENSPTFSQSGASSGATDPVQVAEVQESCFGVSDICFNAVQGLLLIGATDSSLGARVDAGLNVKLTNLRNAPTSQLSLWRQSKQTLRFDMEFSCKYQAGLSCVALSMTRERGFGVCGLGDGTVGFYEINSGSGRGTFGTASSTNILPLLRHTAGVTAIALDDSEQWVISTCGACQLIIYDMRRQMTQCEVQTPAIITTMHYCEPQKRLFGGMLSGRIVAYDLSTLPIRQLAIIPDSAELVGNTKICSLDYDSVTSTLFSAKKDGLAIWTVKSGADSCWGRCTGQIKDIPGAPTAMAWINSSRELLVALGSTISVYDVDGAGATYNIPAHSDEISSIIFLDGPRRMFSASKDKTVKIWDFPTCRSASLQDSIGSDTPTHSYSSSAAPPTYSGFQAKDRFGAPASSFNRNDPLGLPPGNEAPGRAGYPGLAGADPFSNSGGARGSLPSSASLLESAKTRPPTFAAKAAPASSSGPLKVAGAAQGATFLRHDSDDEDDLLGWDN